MHAVVTRQRKVGVIFAEIIAIRMRYLFSSVAGVNVK